MTLKRLLIGILIAILLIWAVQLVVGCDVGEGEAQAATPEPDPAYNVTGSGSWPVDEDVGLVFEERAGKRCGVARHEKWHNGITGRLFTVKLRAYFCVRRGRVVSADPSMKTTINTAGSIGQWEADGRSGYGHFFRWRGRNHGGYIIHRTAHFSREFCLFGNCVTVGSSEIYLQLRLKGNGTYRRK